MYRKLVKLDPDNGWSFSEVDLICVRRAAAALKDYMERCIDPDDDPYEIRDQVLPLCEGALDGTLKLPLVFADLPLKYPSREGLVPESFSHYWANFTVPATGSHLETPQEVLVDGERCAYMDFEEPGDWPEVVAECEKKRKETRWRDEYHWSEERRQEVEARARHRQAMLDAEERELEEKLRQKRARHSRGS
jgi:hypothetical protein